MAKFSRRKGTKKDLQTKSNVPFEVTGDKPFNIAKLVKVEAKVLEKKDGGHQPVIDFIFSNKDETRNFTHREFAIEEDWDNNGTVYTIEDQAEWQDRKIAHIFNTFKGDEAHETVANCFEVKEGEFEPSADLDDDLNEWYDYYRKVAHYFNEDRKIGKGKAAKTIPAYQNDDETPIFFWIKLVYDKRDILQLPRYGNFLDPYVKGRNPLLTIGKKDKVDKSPSFQPTTTIAGNTNNGGQQIVEDDDMPEGF